jgi:23S rRNA (cytosine1962-C5)-methyltransferase
MTRIVLERGRERSLLRHHPWVFSGAISDVQGGPSAGDTVEVVASDGLVLGLGAFSPRSQIAVRMWTFTPSVRKTQREEAGPQEVGPELFRARIERALATREPVPPEEEPAGRRLVNAESDGLPGVIVDRYGGHLVCQFLSAGAERWKETIVETLVGLLSPESVSERSDSDGRDREGLSPSSGTLFHGAAGEPPERVEIVENGVRYRVDLRRGHKTGFYLDQRLNRAEVARHAVGARMLNAFAYTGGFGIAALAGGAAEVTNVEASADMLAALDENVALNDLDPSKVENVQGNAFSLLRGFRAEGRRFDLVVLDPPKFADSRSRLEKAARGYKDVNLLACQLLEPGGLLATFSCSGVLQAELFQKIVADAALDAGRDARILRHFHQAPDHPVSLAFPEGSYLKGLLCQVW